MHENESELIEQISESYGVPEEELWELADIADANGRYELLRDLCRRIIDLCEDDHEALAIVQLFAGATKQHIAEQVTPWAKLVPFLDHTRHLLGVPWDEFVQDLDDYRLLRFEQHTTTKAG